MAAEWKFEPKQVRLLSDYFSIIESGGKLDRGQRLNLKKKLGSNLETGPSLSRIVLIAGLVVLGGWALNELLKPVSQPTTPA